MNAFLTKKLLNDSGAEWPVGRFRRMPEGPAARREKVPESMKTIRVV